MLRPPEDDLFRRFRDGREAAALAEVFDLLAPSLLRIACHLSGRRDEAEDLVQQTFVVAIERAASWNASLGLFPWLIGILTNQARLRRRSAARSVDPERLRPTPSESPDASAERGELAAAIARAVEELGEVYQPVLHLHLFHGLNAKEIGAALGRPAGSVRTQIVRGLAHLRRVLPVGLGVVAVTALGSGHGLAAMREAVLARAIEAGAVGAGVGVVSLGGLLAMKKTVVMLSALLAALLGTLVFWTKTTSEAVTPRGRDGIALPHAPAASSAADPGAGAPTPAVSRSVVSTPAATSAGERVIPMTGRVHGRVIDDVGQPVGDAEIWAGDDIAGQGAPPDDLLRLATRSAADGTFVALHAAAEARIAARKSGYAASLSHPTETLGDGEVTLVLRRGGASVAGVVVDAHDQPVADAILGMQLQGERLHRAEDGTLLAPRLPLLLRTDNTGQFAAADLAPGSYLCRVGSPRHVYATTHFTVAEGGHRDLHVRLEPTVALVGRVRDPADAGIVGAFVWITLSTGSTMTTRTGRDGRFEFPRVPAPPFVVAAARRADGSVARHAIASAAAEDLTCELTLEQLPAIVGRVRTEVGRPLAGWHVAALDAAGGSLASRSTDADGGFALEDLGTGRFTLVVRQTADDHDEPACTRGGVAAGGAPIELVVPARALPQAVILGRVVTPDGRALPEARIELVDADGTRAVPIAVEPEGAFRLEALGRGFYTVVASSPGRLRCATRVELAHAQTLDLGALVLAPEASLRVRYLRPDGTPWRNRPPVPWLQDERGEWLTAGRSGDVAYAVDGDEVVVTGLSAGRYLVHGPRGDELVIGTREVTLVAGASARLQIPVAVGRQRTLRFAAPPKSDPAPTLHVEIRDAADRIVLRTALSRGLSSSFAHTQAFLSGRYEVSAHTDAGTRYRAAFAVDVARVTTDSIEVPIAR